MKAVFSFLIAGLFSLHLSAADWSQWRGANRDGILTGEKALGKLPAKPAAQWQLPVGKGQGGLVIAGGKLLMLHEVTVKGQQLEAAVLMDAASGKRIWETAFAPSWQYRNVYGPGPRVAPHIDGDLIYCQGVVGVLACLRASDGKVLWSVSYEKDFGAKWFGGNAPGSGGTAASRHGNAGAPVTDEKFIYAAAGGHEGASLVCLDKRTGKLIWKSGNDYAAYTGLMLGKLAGVQQVVVLTAAHLKGVRASDGKELWSVPVVTGAARNILTPILSGDTVTVASHTVGTFQLRITNSGDMQKTTEVWRNEDVRTNITTPVLIDGHLYGLGTTRGKNSPLVCLEHKTGKVKWSQPGYTDYASVIAFDGELLIHGSRGALTLVKATPEKYTELSRVEQVSQISWNFPVYTGGVLYVKDGLRDGGNKLTALKLR